MTDGQENAPVAGASQLLSLLTDTAILDVFLDRVVHLAADVVTPPASCGLTLRRDGQPFTVVSSNDLAAQVDEIQYGHDDGPCLDSLRHGVIVQVDDLTQEERWDGYPAHALVHGVMSSLSLPLIVDGQTVAALNLYSGQPATFDGPPRHHAVAFAEQCAAALTLALRQTDQTEVHQQLLEAVTSRTIIDQDIGILMGQQRCTSSTAFDLLRQASQHRNRKLRDIATDLITNVTGKSPEPPAEFKIHDRPAPKNS